MSPNPEPDLVMTDSTAALGQLWSTTGDLARWGAFIAEGRDGVLDRTTLDEMARVQAMAASASTGAKGREAGGSADVRSDRRRAGRARGVAPR